MKDKWKEILRQSFKDEEVPGYSIPMIVTSYAALIAEIEKVAQ